MKRTLIVVILGISSFLALIVSLHAREKKEDESLLFLMAARNASKAGWTNKAIQRYEAYLQKNPEDKDIELEFADFLQNSEYYHKAGIHYDILIQKMGNAAMGKDDFSKKLMLSAARNAIKNKNEDRAIEYYKQALLSDERDAKVAREAAGVLAGLERFGEALELCEKILLNDPQNLEVLTLKINLLVQQKKYAEAREALSKIPYDKDNLKLLQLASDIEAWSGNYDKAIEKYQNLVSRFPENHDIWSQYIKVLSWAKQWSLLLDTIRAGGDKIEITDNIRSILVDAYLSVGEEEKALQVWRTIHRESDTWRATALMIADKFLSRRKLTEASNILEEIVSASKPVPEVHLLAKLALIYTYRGMPGKGFEILNQFRASSQSKPIIDIAKAEILALTGCYEDALSILHTLEGDKEIGLRPRIIELECYYALEKDEMLLKKSSLLLQKLSPEEQVDNSKVLTLRILSQIRMGLFKKAEEEIELFSSINNKDFGPSILTVLLNDAKRQIKEYEESNQVLSKLLSTFSSETEMVRPQLLDDVPLTAWKVADEIAKHANPEVTVQRARAEFKAGNFQQALNLYKELNKANKAPGNELGLVECYLNLNEAEDACKLFEEIQIHNLPEKEIARYFEALVRLKKNKEALYFGLSVFPKDISQKTDVKAIMVIANIQSGDNEVANGIIKNNLSNPPEHMAIFQTVLERIGYFDKGKKSKNYEFAKDWLRQGVERFPDDTGLRYQYAKLLATHNDYDLADEQFLVLQQNDQKDVRALRWLGRVNAWGHEYDESVRWYDLYLRDRPSDFQCRLEVARVYGWALRFQEANEAYKNLCKDYPEDPEIHWEWEAKRNNWLERKRTAISLYNKLIERHPEDAELQFDLGQMYSMLNLSSKAEDAYNRLLVYAPEHNRAQFAEESEQWRRMQSARLKESYIHQEGSGDEFGSYEITRFRTDADYSPVRLFEATDISLGLGNTIFKFKEHGGSCAEHLTAKFNKYFENGIGAYLSGELSTYSENRHETAQFETGVNYRVFDMFGVSLSEGREDVLQNFNTLKHRRGRYYTGISFSWDISQRIDLSSQFKKYWYNDGNNGIEDYTVIGYKLFLYPRILKFVIETYGFDAHSRKDEYWSPDNYRKFMGGIIWRHYLGDEHFSGAPKLYYEIAVKQGVDVNGDDFTEPKFEFGWDNQRRWNVGLEIKSIQSSVYEEERANAFVSVRF